MHLRPTGDLSTHSQSMLLRSSEDVLAVIGRESTTIGEDIHKLCKSTCRHFWNHLLTYELHLLLRASAELIRCHMRAKQSGDHRSRPRSEASARVLAII